METVVVVGVFEGFDSLFHKLCITRDIDLLQFPRRNNVRASVQILQ